MLVTTPLLGGEPAEVAFEQLYSLPPGGSTIRLCWDKSPPREIRINGAIQEFDSAQSEFVVPFGPASGRLILAICDSEGRYTTNEFVDGSFQALQQKLLFDLADFYSHVKKLTDKKPLTFGALQRALATGELSLLVRSKPYTAKQSDLHLRTILRALPSLQRVMHKPRQHLRVDEAVRPVSVVRRTGPAALRHLAQHSEHWETLTVNGLRAARLLAKVIDDDLDLYENRFVVTLMKVLRIKMVEIVAFADIGFSQAQNAIDIESYVDELNDYRAQKMLKVLLPTSTTDEMLEEFYLYEGILKKAHAILRVLSECQETQLYRQLKDSRLVQEPILPTNILTMDSHYRELLNLWRDLKRLLPEDEGTGELPPDIDAAYVSYCQVMTLAAIHHAGFKPKGGPEQVCVEQKKGGYTVASGKFENSDWIVALGQQENMRCGMGLTLSFRRKLPSKFPLPVGVEMPDIPQALSNICRYVDGFIEFSDRPDDQELTALSELVHEATRPMQHRTRRGSHDEAVLWKTFVWDRVRPRLPRPVQFDCVLVPVLSAIGADAYDLEKNSELLLNHMLEETKRSNLKSLLLLVPTSPREVPAETPSRVVRRLLNCGDSYFSEDASRWGQGRTGVLPVSPWALNSLQRVSRLIRMRTLASDIEGNRLLATCPICESVHITTDGEGDYYSCRCKQCHSLWGMTSCRCGYRYPLLRLERRQAAQYFGDIPYRQWVERVESAAGIVAFPAFCEAGDAPAAFFPICPKCGRCNKREHFTKCLRCTIHEPEAAARQDQTLSITF